MYTIESVERTLIPFGIRLFGASGYGGYYHFPNIGRAFVVITNFRDGVLIRAKQGIYRITPRTPTTSSNPSRKWENYRKCEDYG